MIKMYELTVRTNHTEHKKSTFLNRTVAEAYADVCYQCADVYAVELINAGTGEVVYYRAKEW